MTWISSLIMTLTVGALFGVRRSSWDAHQIEILSLRNKLPLAGEERRAHLSGPRQLLLTLGRLTPFGGVLADGKVVGRIRMQVRDIAARMNDDVPKQMMLMVADDYDRLADAIERDQCDSKKRG